MAEKVRMGVAGLGRSGWRKHAETPFSLSDKYEIVAVADPLEEKRQQAVKKFGCRAYAEFQDLIADADVEVVAIATPSHLHAPNAISALEAGKNVVCEKPMAATLPEADAMIEAATKTGNLLTIFHQRRYAPDFVKVKEVIASGKLGRIVSIRMCSHYFTRRYDWQTVAALGGGELRNNASHPLDQAFQLIGEGEPELFCDLQKTVTFGDAEDHVKIVLKIPGTPVVDIEVSACQAFPQENWLVVGTQGSLTGTSQALRWKHFDPAQLPHREVDRGPAGSYPSDDIPWKEESWEIPADGKPDETIYYEELHKTLRGGAPLPVTPQSVRRVMWVIEECLRRHAPAQGY